MGFDLFRGKALAAQSCPQGHGIAACVGRRNEFFGGGAAVGAFKTGGERVVGVAEHARSRRDGAFAFFE